MLKRSAAYLIFDFDDAIYCDHESTEIDKASNLYNKFKSIVSKADLILAGNNILKKAASEFNDNIEIDPSAVFVKRVPLKDYAHHVHCVTKDELNWPLVDGRLHTLDKFGRYAYLLRRS